MILFLALVAGAIVAFRFRARTNARMEAMESTLVELTARVATLEASRAAGVTATAVPPTTTMSPAPATRAESPVPVAPPTLLPDPRPAPPPAGPVFPPATVPVVTGAVSRSVEAVPVEAVSRSAEDARSEAPGTSHDAIAPSRSDAREALETRIGSRWLLYIGVVAIVVGVSYFEKLAFDNQWIGETARVVQGALIGLLLVVAGLRFVRAGYRVYGQVVSGCGIAILYVSTYAAFNFYHLIDEPPAFALMSGVTMLAAWLSDRQRSQSLALAAVGGGFATPFLLRGTTDAEIALFGYETILIAGTTLLSRRRDWPTLNVASYAFTVLTVGAWAARFYTASKYLPTELFLTVFCAMFLYILRESRHSRHALAKAERAILWTAPSLYYIASWAILSPHSAAFLVYLVILSLVGILVSSRAGSKVRLAFWLAVVAPLLLWSDAHGGRTWLVAGLAAWTGVYLLNLVGLLEATLGEDHRFGAADIALLHLNGLVAYLGAYLLLEQARIAATAPLAAGLALLQGILSVAAVRRCREEALHFVALGFTLLTIAIALQFDGAWVTSGWAAEGAVLMWLGLRERREWLRLSGLLLFAVAIARLTTLQFSDPPVGQLLLFNPRAVCSLFVVALTYLLTLAHHVDAARAGRQTKAGIGLVAANLLLLALAASEIAAYWKLHTPPPFEPASQLIVACVVAGAVTMWLGLSRREEWIRLVGGAIVAVGTYSLLSIQLDTAPRGYVTLLNSRAAAGGFTVVMLCALAALHVRIGRHLSQLSANVALLTTAASLFTLSLLTSEVDAFWASRGAAAAWSITREGLQSIVWASVGGFLIWQGLSNRRAWIRAIGSGLLAVAIVRLLRAQFADPSPAYIVAANARAVAALIVIAMLYGLAHLYRDAGDAIEAGFAPRTILLLIANVLTLTLLTSEITAYWRMHDIRPVSASASANSHFAREMMLSITWAAYATLLVVVGLMKRYAPIRYFAMSVFVLTIVKVFAIDLAELDRIYRVLSVVGLGVMLLTSSYLYQRFHKAADLAP